MPYPTTARGLRCWFRCLCDVAHSKGALGGSRVTLEVFEEAHNIRETLPAEDQNCQTHAHTISKLGLCHVLQVKVSFVFNGDSWRGEA